MLHKMKLQEDPFERIKNGTKTVEFRLYDEKRRTIQIMKSNFQNYQNYKKNY